MNEELKKEFRNTLLFLLDGSGSMFTRKAQTLEALNQYINSIKDRPLTFRLVVWDSERYSVIYHGNIEDCPEITGKRYQCGGSTPLLDTIGKALTGISKDNKKKFVAVLTDGYENASVEYTLDSIKKLVTEFRSEGNEVAFLGAEIDAFSVASQLNINQMYTQAYETKDSTQAFRNLSTNTLNYFSSTKEE